jgi:metal-dependent amidase/aminoacylase/carboxypeptidase family protein
LTIQLTRRCDELRNDLITLSHRIHAHPELGFEEEKASAWLSESLTDAGFAVEKGACDLPTAFIARAGNGPLYIAICAEYDCLPGIGHACGRSVPVVRVHGGFVDASGSVDADK